jgi:hypothetical protein
VLSGPGCYPTSLGRGARMQVDGPVARVRWSLGFCDEPFVPRRCAFCSASSRTISLSLVIYVGVDDDAELLRVAVRDHGAFDVVYRRHIGQSRRTSRDGLGPRGLRT